VKQIFLSFLAMLALSGCATQALQTEAFYREPHHLPSRQEIEAVPFTDQEVGYCGPATLSMVLQYWGDPITQQALASQVYTPGMKGSLQTDLISAARRQGFLAVPITGIKSMLTEIAHGHPVIIFENVGLEWIPQWHYALIFGYDLERREVVMHSGPWPNHRLGLDDLEKSWMLGNYWGLVVLPADRLATTADEISHVIAASGLESAGQVARAEISYRKIISRWPKSLGAKMGLANLSFQKNQYGESIRFLLTATREHPESAMAWHNLAIAQGKNRDLKAARQSARQALGLAPVQAKSTYEANLKDWL